MADKQTLCAACGHNKINRHGECMQCIDWQKHTCVFPAPEQSSQEVQGDAEMALRAAIGVARNAYVYGPSSPGIERQGAIEARDIIVKALENLICPSTEQEE